MNNVKNGSWSVYIHTVPNGKVYIGATGRPPKTRWGGGYNYRENARFYADILNYGWLNIAHDIIESGMSKADALQKEKELIVSYDSTNEEKGYNVKVGNSSIGTHNPFYGKRHSDDFKKQQSERMKGSARHCTAVIQININGDAVAEFPSIKCASLETGINYKSIVNCCLGVTKKAGGYRWQHKTKQK